MKRNYLLSLFLLLSFSGYSQLTIQSGATFFIQTGATVTVQGDVTSNADIQGPGALLMKGSSLQTINLNGFSVQNLQIDNATNVALGGAATIGTSLAYTTGKVQLNGFDLSIASGATITGYDNTKYVITNGTGSLVKNALGASPFIFPVGFDATSYNPTTITQNGTVDNLGVRCLQNVFTTGATGLPYVKEVVDASWSITEAVAGGSNLSITSSWNAGDELPGFNRTKTGISYYDGVGWDMTNLQTGASSGAGPYTITRSGINNVGVFAVGGRPVLTTLKFSPTLYLQGPTFAAGLMSDGLRTSSQIPLTEPYTGLSNFTHLATGSGGGESIPSAILATTGTGNDIVDWGFAQLHRTSDGAVINTHAVLIERDGDWVDVDGLNTKTNFINFAGDVAGSYYVSLRHRNSLGARTATAPALSRTITTTYNFTTALAQAFPGAVANDPMATISTGVFGLWGANANSDIASRRIGSASLNDYSLFLAYLGSNTIVSGVYRREDFNMDGTVRRIGSATVNDYSKFLAILGSFTIITQPAF